jgi:hypothetical protein
LTDGVFIALPVYRGSEVIEETLRSILAQTDDDFHLVMSVDGADDPTVETCRKYTDDPRVDLVVQETRLGWPGNFNWLVESCDREFFCYWQQDDLASTGYLEKLRKELLARPDAAIAYTDVQWFGGRFDRNGSPSIEGDALSRVTQHIEAIRYEPLRGLMRSSMLPQERNAIPVTEDESCQEEFVFLARMAAAGAFVPVDSAMYFKRLHGTNAFVRWQDFPDWRRRRGWISIGAGMYRVARELATPELQPRILGQTLDRLAVERHGRAHFYSPSQTRDELHRFVRDFVACARVADDDLRAPELEPLDRPIHPEIVRALELQSKASAQRANHAEQLRSSGSIVIDLQESSDDSILGFGWSHHEPWGIWSDGDEATLRVPAREGLSWRATLKARTFAPNGPVTVGIAAYGQPMSYAEAGSTEPLTLTIESDPSSAGTIRLHLPDARAPIDDQLSGDQRKLGIGLTQLSIELL